MNRQYIHQVDNPRQRNSGKFLPKLKRPEGDPDAVCLSGDIPGPYSQRLQVGRSASCVLKTMSRNRDRFREPVYGSGNAWPVTGDEIPVPASRRRIISNRARVIMETTYSMFYGLEWIEMNGMEKNSAKALIDRFLSGDLPDDLQMRIGEWITSLKDEDEGAEALQDVFDRYADKYSRTDYRTARIWRKHCERLGFVDNKGRKLLLHKRMMRVAAVIVPMLIAGAGLLLYDRVGVTPQQGQPVEIMVEAAGGPQVLSFPCGTEIRLTAGSYIAYNETGYAKDRNVSLDGEAFFSVAELDGKPFTVDAGGVTVKVLGTQFNVRTAIGTETEVSLVNGSVEVSTPTTQVKLEPMDRFTYNTVTGESGVSSFEPAEAERWRTGKQHLREVPLNEAMRQVASFYGRQLVMEQLPGSVAEVNVVLSDHMAVEDIMEMILFMTGSFSYEVTDTTIYIR